jgi:hypothetical protein
MIDKDWLKARIAEHKQAGEQAAAQANAHNGAMQAYERMLAEMDNDDAVRTPVVDEAL